MSKAYTLSIEIKKQDRKSSWDRVTTTKSANVFLNQTRNIDAKFHSVVHDYMDSAKRYAKDSVRVARKVSRQGGGVVVTLTHNKTGIRIKEDTANCGDIHATLVTCYGLIKRLIRESRFTVKQNAELTVGRYIGSTRYNIRRSGNMIVSGELSRLSSERRSRQVFETKRPTTDENHIGIELEFIAAIAKSELALKLANAGLGKYVTLKSDGSIRVDQSGYHAHELTACIPESLRKVVIAEIAEVLKQANARVNKSCGFHVHLDMRNRNHGKSFSNLVSAQSVLYAMNPKSRQDNQYCKKTRTKNLEQERRGSRYKGVNSAALYKYSTIEIRVHAGTVDEVKINNWVDLLINVTDAQGDGVRAPRTIESFCKRYNISSELRSYIIERIRKFSVAGSDVSEVSEVA